MQSTITISGKLLGRTKPLFENRCVSLPSYLFEQGCPTLRDLLTQIVLQEVEAFHTRSEQQRLLRVLAKAEIDRGVQQGKITAGGRDWQQTVDPQSAVDNTLQAFVDGFYFVSL